MPGDPVGACVLSRCIDAGALAPGQTGKRSRRHCLQAAGWYGRAARAKPRSLVARHLIASPQPRSDSAACWRAAATLSSERRMFLCTLKVPKFIGYHHDAACRSEPRGRLHSLSGVNGQNQTRDAKLCYHRFRAEAGRRRSARNGCDAEELNRGGYPIYGYLALSIADRFLRCDRA